MDNIENLKERIASCHAAELIQNKELGKLDKIILEAQKKKLKVGKRISKSMLHRNQLAERLSKLKP